MDKPLNLAEIREKVAPIAKQYGVKKAFVFGSYARGEADSKSDVDLCIEEGRRLSLFDLSGLYLDLEEHIGAKIDVVTTGGLKGSFREAVEKERILIYG